MVHLCVRKGEQMTQAFSQKNSQIGALHDDAVRHLDKLGQGERWKCYHNNSPYHMTQFQSSNNSDVP